MKEIEGWQTLDDKGVIMPWYTRPCLEWLQAIDLKGKKIFEYGVGYSTLWYESRGAVAWGVDSNEKWAKMGKADFCPDKSKYINYINHPCLVSTQFDIVCIDGNWRDECLKIAYSRVKKGGYIIIDNYKQATADLAEWPITEKLIENLEVHYYKEPTHEDWQTIVIHV